MTIPPENSFHPQTQAELRAWLEQNHARDTGIWLIYDKKSAGKTRIDYTHIVDELLCFGWIDSTPNKLDAERAMLWISPRKRKSGWSRVNKEKIARLRVENRIHAAGLAVIDRAKLDGSWTALDLVETLVLPDDFAAELAKYPTALEHFNSYPKSVRRMILLRIDTAKRPETRAKRIAEATAHAANHATSTEAAENSGNGLS